MPFAIKDQSVAIVNVEPATGDEQAAIDENGRIHHRDETYTGIEDPTLLGARRLLNVLRPGDALTLAFGVTVPLGATEEDPLALGEAGKEHLHIQFGTGTFDPVVEFSYAAPLLEGVTASLFASTRVPLYESGRSFRGPRELSAGTGLARSLSAGAFVHASYTYFRQGRARWDGAVDPNSGLEAHSLTVGAGIALGGSARLRGDARTPLGQRTLARGGDTFEQGPTFVISLEVPLGKL